MTDPARPTDAELEAGHACFMDCTLPPPSPDLQGVMDVAAAAQTAGIEWQGRSLADVQADLADFKENP